MGREIRKVKPDWEHPKDYKGHCKPVYDRSFKSAVQEWIEGFQEYLSDYPSGFGKDGHTYPEWDNHHPDREYYRPEWTGEEATAYQVYENVTEGTPVSPVFQSEDDMRTWLRDEWKLSQEAIDNFIKLGFSFSMIMTPGRGISKPGPDTIEAMVRLEDRD